MATLARRTAMFVLRRLELTVRHKKTTGDPKMTVYRVVVKCDATGMLKEATTVLKTIESERKLFWLA